MEVMTTTVVKHTTVRKAGYFVTGWLGRNRRTGNGLTATGKGQRVHPGKDRTLMDPDAALDAALDSTRPAEDRLAHAQALHGWISRGGFPPAAWSPREAPFAAARLLANCIAISIGMDPPRHMVSLDDDERSVGP
jgi:hypothetical protein